MSEIGACYLFGYGVGAMRNYTECQKWYRLAAENGDAQARHYLDDGVLTMDYFNEIGRRGEKSGREQKGGYHVVECARDGNTTRIRATLDENADILQTVRRLKADLLADCENDLMLRERNLSREEVGWDFAYKTTNAREVECSITWIYMRVVSHEYNPNTRTGKLVLMLGEKSYRDARDYLVYESQIEALRVIASLGYQALHLRACRNSTEAAAKMKEVQFPEPTLVGQSIRQFYDHPGLVFNQIMAWGQNFPDDVVDEHLRNVVAGEKSRAARALKWPMLNERFYLFPHMFRDKPRKSIAPRFVNANARLERWREIHRIVKNLYIVRLWVLRFATTRWTEKAPSSTFKKIFLEHKSRFDFENAEVVKRAREIYYDFPFVVAGSEFKKAVRDCRHIFGLMNDVEGMRVAASRFVGDIAGDEMLLNIKSGYAYDIYMDALLCLKSEAKIVPYEDILVSLKMKDLANIDLFKAGTGDTLWATNALTEFKAVETAKLDEERQRKEEAEAKRKAERQSARDAREAERQRAKDAKEAENERRRIEKEAERQKREAELEKKRQEEETKRLQMAQEAEERKRKQEAEAEERRQIREAELEKKRQEEETKRLQMA